VANHETVADYDDKEALSKFAAAVDVVTFEFENVPAETAAHLSSLGKIFPDPRVLRVAQDRLIEKQFLQSIGEQTAPSADITSLDDLHQAISTIKTPAVLKTRRFGYDGKGQVIIRNSEDCPSAYEQIAQAPAILEGFVEFDREISVIAARSTDGQMVCYDPGENIHANHILKTTIAPARIPSDLVTRAQATARNIMEQLDYMGVIGVELFEMDAGDLIVNEIAPRVHNSGHWTQDACAVSQFEQHIRAICQWPLGDTTRHSDAIMTNLIGPEVKDWPNLVAKTDNCLHLYGKRQAREGRKMGHVNRLLPLGHAKDANGNL
jgi:5-(carboxyamino)imidazole ribonucleotide synthase